jgi:hypothetical protein
MMVRVDEAGQHDHTRRVDHDRLGADIRAQGDDLLVLDQYVGLLEVSDGGIEAEHHAALEQGTNRAALGDSRPRHTDGGRSEQGSPGFHQRAPVDSFRCRSRRFGAVVTHGAFLLKRFLISKGPAPNMSKTTIVDKRRSCSSHPSEQRPRRHARPGPGNDQISGPVMLLGNDGRRTGVP